MTRSALAPRCFQAIFAVLAYSLACRRGRRAGAGLSDAGSAAVVRRRDGSALGWWGEALSTPQPPEAVAEGQRLQSLAPPATMGPPSDGLGADGTEPVGLVVGHHRPGDAGEFGSNRDDRDVARLATEQPAGPDQEPVLRRLFEAAGADQQGLRGEHQIAAHLTGAHLADAVQRLLSALACWRGTNRK